MTPEELLNLIQQRGVFKIPMTYQVFLAIREMSEQQVDEVISLYNLDRTKKLQDRKTELNAQLQIIEAQIQDN